jgi:TRAF3-interacting protein 1
MDPSLATAINNTKEVLQPLFTKPTLSTKLLEKPPFRFIHDIVIATLTATGFPKDFFTDFELDSSNFKENKTAKVSFLDKLIHLVNVGNGSALEVSSSKIVAGLDALKTNELLVAFARLALNKEIDKTGLIQHCLAGKGIDEFHIEQSTTSLKLAENPVPSNDEMKEIVIGVSSFIEQEETVDDTESAAASTFAPLEPTNQEKIIDAAPLVPSLGNVNVRPDTAHGTRPATAMGARPDTARGKRPSIIKQREIEVNDVIRNNEEEMRQGVFDLQQNQHQPRINSKMFSPLQKLSDVDFQSLASAVRHISQLASSDVMRNSLNSVPSTIDRLIKERSYWVAEQHRVEEALANLEK